MKKRLIAILLVALFLLAVTGCSMTSGVVGEYHGTAGSYLKINKDGTCIYAEDDDTGTGTGDWYIEDGVIYIDVSNLSYTVHGDVSNAKEGILLESSAGSWNTEYFEKD